MCDILSLLIKKGVLIMVDTMQMGAAIRYCLNLNKRSMDVLTQDNLGEAEKYYHAGIRDTTADVLAILEGKNDDI